MPESIQKAKAAIRQKMRELLKRKTSADHLEASIQARLQLEQWNIWKDAGSVFFYAPLAEELDVWPLVCDSLTAKKIVCLPRFDSATHRYMACQIQNIVGDIVIGQFGIREPSPHCVVVPLKQLDLVLVPGMAFDSRGYRLGRGKGFYDQLLSEVTGIKCGVAFDEQIIPEIPAEPHDVQLHYVLTPLRWIQP